MALLDFLKKKKEVEKNKEKKPGKNPPAGGEKVSVAAEPKEVKEVKSSKLKKGVKGFSYEVVKEPHISEKSTILSEVNQYVFKIYSRSNKPEVKKAIEGIYGVDV